MRFETFSFSIFFVQFGSVDTNTKFRSTKHNMLNAVQQFWGTNQSEGGGESGKYHIFILFVEEAKFDWLGDEEIHLHDKK